MPEPCPICNDLGLRLVLREDGTRLMEPCVCRMRRRAEKLLAQASIPRRYQDCLLDNYETKFPSAHRSLGAAHLRAKKFVESYPLETGGTGLLLTGSIGVGKTHLAVGILHALVTERGATGLFVDYRDLLKQVQHSYNPSVAATEMQILAPVFEAEVLVLDELGASKPHRLGLGHRRPHPQHPLQRPPHHHYHDQLLQPRPPYSRHRQSHARRHPRRPHRRAYALPPVRDVCCSRDARRRLPPEGKARQLWLIQSACPHHRIEKNQPPPPLPQSDKPHRQAWRGRASSPSAP